MKTKHFCLLLLSAMLLAACENKLDTPSGLQGRQMGNTIVLAWNMVEGATAYEIHGSWGYKQAYTTNFTDVDPQPGYNSYEICAYNGNARSKCVSINVFYDEGNSSGNNSGGTTPGENTETNLPFSTSNIAGYWQLKQEIMFSGTVYNYQNKEYYNFANNGMWELIYIDSPTKCYVDYGTWEVSGSTLIEFVEAENCFENGKYIFSYPAVNRTDSYTLKTLTSTTMSYCDGSPNTYILERVNSIPASYQHNNEIDKNGSSGGGSSNLTVTTSNLSGTWTCDFNGTIFYWVLQSSGAAYLIIDDSPYSSTGTYQKCVGTWTVNVSAFIFNQTKHYYYDGGVLETVLNESDAEIVYITSLTSDSFVDDDDNTWIKTTLPNYIEL